MPPSIPLNLARQADEIARQRDLPPGCEGHYRMWEDVTSPYSAKVRVYLHYKGIPFRRMRTTFADYLTTLPALVGMPIIPVLLTPDERVMQDSTPILEWFEGQHPEPSAVPEDPALAFVHWLVEDFADEYLPRFAMHYRWGNELNRDTLSHRIARRFSYGDPGGDVGASAGMVLARQSGYDLFLGLDPVTRRDLDEQLLLLLAILEAHFRDWQFLFGDRPSVADFALYGPLFAHLWSDPGSSRLMEVHGPQTCHWMETITSLGDSRGAVGQTLFGEWLRPEPDLPDTLKWLLHFIGTTYVPFGSATARASLAREKTFTVEIRGFPTTCSTHHYRAWALEQVQLRLEGLGGEAKERCRGWLEEAGVLPGLMAGGILHNGLFDGFTPPFVVDGVMDNRVKHLKSRG